jgi:uncharacterized protein (DUF2147 family)
MIPSRSVCASSAAAFVCLFAVALLFSARLAQGQVACNQVGNHLIKVVKTQGSNQLVDCESARISRSKKHTVTWQASGNNTLTIEFAAGASPFLKFSCKDQKKCTSGEIDPNAIGKTFKYTVTLKSGSNTYVEDPDVVIDPEPGAERLSPEP